MFQLLKNYMTNMYSKALWHLTTFTDTWWCNMDGEALTVDSLRTATSIHNCFLCTVLVLTVEISWHLAFLENISCFNETQVRPLYIISLNEQPVMVCISPCHALHVKVLLPSNTSYCMQYLLCILTLRCWLPIFHHYS